MPEPPKHNWHAGLQYVGDVARAKAVLKDLEKHYPGGKNFEVAGFLWWQGDKDRYNAAHSAMYGKNLAQLFKALRKEFNAPKAKMVVATLGQTDKDEATGNEKMIIDGMFAFGKAHPGEAAVVYTHPLSMGSSSNAHYGGNAKTYMNVGLRHGRGHGGAIEGGQLIMLPVLMAVVYPQPSGVMDRFWITLMLGLSVANGWCGAIA